MRRRRRDDANTHHERWLVSYADLVTLLFALFVVLFASAYHDKKAVQRVSSAVKNGFQELEVFSPSSSTGSAKSAERGGPAELANPVADSEMNPTPNYAGINVLELQEKLNNALGKEIARREIVMRMTPEGFVISLHELGFFDSGEARLLPGAAEKLKRIAGVLMQYGLDMRVEGHSDDVPIHNASFASNWELSTARAMAVAMMLLDDSGFDPARMSIAGYGQYHPCASNSTPDGRKANRRVDIVVLSAAKSVTAKIQ
jgi:chemotaxis protein MotB